MTWGVPKWHAVPMRLDDWMTEVGKSDEVLATHLGVDRTTVSRIRRGTRRPSIPLAEAISKASGFRVRLDDFSILPELTTPRDAEAA